jgi:hypothetical protein
VNIHQIYTPKLHSLLPTFLVQNPRLHRFIMLYTSAQIEIDASPEKVRSIVRLTHEPTFLSSFLSDSDSSQFLDFARYNAWHRDWSIEHQDPVKAQARASPEPGDILKIRMQGISFSAEVKVSPSRPGSLSSFPPSLDLCGLRGPRKTHRILLPGMDRWATSLLASIISVSNRAPRSRAGRCLSRRRSSLGTSSQRSRRCTADTSRRRQIGRHSTGR